MAVPPPSQATGWARLEQRCAPAVAATAPAWSLLDLPGPLRAQVFLHTVGDLLQYSGANEVNVQLDTLRGVCRELKEQIDEGCLTFNYDDTCGMVAGSGTEAAEMQLLNACIRRHPRLRYFECLLRSSSRFQAMLEGLELPPSTRCSFAFEFKVSIAEVVRLFERFRVRRISVIPQEEGQERSLADWIMLPKTSLHTVCLRSCSDVVVRAFLERSPRLQCLQVMDSRLVSDTNFRLGSLMSLSLTGIVMTDEHFTRLLAGCQNLRTLYITKCFISTITIALPHLELLSVTHCRQLTDDCTTEMLKPTNNPSLRYLDLTEDRGLVSPTIAHPGLEIAWLMHCQQLTDHVISQMFQNCTLLTAANLVQSACENAWIASPALRTLELTTSQRLTDNAVTLLLQHCPSLTFLDIGHCCQLVEPKFAHPVLETILLSFCVNLRESAIVGLFAKCPSLRYVELAVCMFDMTRFQRECSPQCQVVVNFDF